jgi:CHASE3 domain sensor protein
MRLGVRRSFKILAPGNSLQKRTAYSLAIVRLILVPVFFLAVYYLFRMSHIVDIIVNVDAQAAALAQQASIEMLEARRAERNYLLLHDPQYLEENRLGVENTRKNLEEIRNLEPDEQTDVDTASQALALYQQRLAAGVATLEKPGKRPTDRIEAVVRAYERDLDNLLLNSKHTKREQLVEQLRSRIDSFDSQITRTAQQENPELDKVSQDLNTSGEEVLRITSELESRNWNKIKKEHTQTRRLMRQAEWSLGIVSTITLLISVWVSYVLPRQVIKPLLRLKRAVDLAAGRNYEIEFDVEGKGETVELAKSLRNMFAAMRQKH